MIELESARLRLRELDADDLEPMMAVHLSNPDFLSYMEGSEGETGKYDLERWQRDWFVAKMMPERHMLGCYLKPQGEPVGFLEFAEEEYMGKPWLGVLSIHSAYHRQGLASEAFQCLIDYGRKAYGWSVLRAGALEVNVAGMGLARHLGFHAVEEGLQRFAGGEQRYIVFERSLAEA
jgi:RimJ/RimL family protein N-acetyltransferase